MSAPSKGIPALQGREEVNTARSSNPPDGHRVERPDGGVALPVDLADLDSAGGVVDVSGSDVDRHGGATPS
jgi:hypothetical protein